MMIGRFVALASLAFAAAASAQPLGNMLMPDPAPKAGAAAAGAPTVIKAGTMVQLKVPDDFSGKAAVGQRVQLSVASEVRSGEKVVIPAGAWAEGQVTEVRDGGVAGKMSVKMLTVRGLKLPPGVTSSGMTCGISAA